MEMEMEMEGLTSIKEMRQKLESRVDALHTTQVDLITSLQSSLVPDLVSSLDLSLKAISVFNHKPFTPLAQILHTKPNNSPKLPLDNPPEIPSGRISFVRSMVAVCLLERVPFSPIDSSTLLRKLEEKSALGFLRESSEAEAILAVEMALRSMAHVELKDFVVGGKSRVMVLNIDRPMLFKENKQQQLLNYDNNNNNNNNNRISNRVSEVGVGRGMGMSHQRKEEEGDSMEDVEALLNKKSFKEMQNLKTGEELWDLIHQPTAKEKAEAAKFRTKGGPQLKEYCSALTKEYCRSHSGSYFACDKLHFQRIIAAHTDVNLGDCSFLDNCHHMKTCKYVHYELDSSTPHTMMSSGQAAHYYCSEVELGEPQWINCDIRSFRMDILGQFGVIMADPPWDIHMELPYGTMADDEMRTLNVPALQTDGLIFLWVTGRAMELGRECLQLWGYKRVEEITWVKTNQLQRIIKTGRTGHWLNHSKEHCLVGVKGNPEVNRNIDTDVIVAEVRETSRKPDEMYAMLERLSPRTRKLELFARGHNVQAGWLSLGNQLPGVRLIDEGLRARYKAAYPNVGVQPSSPPRSTAAAMDVDPPFPPPSSSGSPFAEPKLIKT